MAELASLETQIDVSPQGVVSNPIPPQKIKLVANSSHPYWGCFCLYHPTNPQAYGDPLIDESNNSALLCMLTDLYVSFYGQAGQKGETKWKGNRPYVIAVLQTPTPAIRYQLAMPASGSGYVYRSFLAYTQELDLKNKSVILQGKQGRKDATFCEFFVDNQPVRLDSPLIDSGIAAMEQAVNRSRINLGLAPQFKTISGSIDV